MSRFVVFAAAAAFFAAALFGAARIGAAPLAYDTNGDGGVSFADAQFVVSHPNAPQSDVNHDGRADLYDAIVVVRHLVSLGDVGGAPPLPATATPTAPPATATSTAPPATATATPRSSAPQPAGLLSLSQIVAWRGAHNPPHEITLADPMGCCYSWGKHPTEDTPAISGSHSINAWIVAFRGAGEQTTTPDVRINIRRLYAYVHTGGVWKKVYDGNLSGQWLATSNGDTSGDYQNIKPIVEPDGSYSFVIPPNRALHLSSNAPGLQFNGSDGVVSVVEARLLGPDSATLGIAAGADFRDSSGSGGSIQQSCWGHLGLLTRDWRALSCLSSSMSDAQFLLDPPPID